MQIVHPINALISWRIPPLATAQQFVRWIQIALEVQLAKQQRLMLQTNGWSITQVIPRRRFKAQPHY